MVDIAYKMKTESDPLYNKMDFDQKTDTVCELFSRVTGTTGECASDGSIVNVKAGCENPETCFRYRNYFGGAK